jgi:hypothetical protein
MIALIRSVPVDLASLCKSKSRLEAENVAARQPLIVLRRKSQGRARLTNGDRRFFVQLYRWFPSILDVLTILRQKTVVRWHRVGFRRYWQWNLGRRGRPQPHNKLRVPIRQMSFSVFGEAHLRPIQRCYAHHHHETRMHRSLDNERIPRF